MSSVNDAEAASEKPFGRLRGLIWPIRRYELKKVLPMLGLYTLIVFIYSLLKPAKDSLVITDGFSSGASTIPFIKFWAILPMAFLFTFLFTRLSNKYSRENVFYIMMIIFLSFFILFGFVLYPLRDTIRADSLAHFLESLLPIGFHGLISIIRNWSFTLFYVMAELWGTTIMTVLFWGFANEVSSVKDAKRYYAILGIGANIATVCAGLANVVALNTSSFFMATFYGMTSPSQAELWGNSIMLITFITGVTGLIAMGIFRWLNVSVLKSTREGFAAGKDSKGIKMGMRKNFSYLANSRYLLFIAIIVVTYNLSLNLVEVVWKDQVRTLYPDPSQFNSYMGQVMVMQGLVSTVFALFLCGSVIRKFGWTIGALVTPVTLFVTGSLFFTLILFQDTAISIIPAIFNSSPLFLIVFFGATQNIFSRASKFTFFDSTKEMAFIPLSNESKLKGKAAIDGVGSRLGKSGGALFHQLLLFALGTVAASTPIVAVILLGITITWIIAVKALGKEFNALASENPPETPEKKLPTKEPTYTEANQEAIG